MVQPESESSKPRLSSCPRKLCVVYHFWEHKSDNYEYKFYIVGRDSPPGGGGGDKYPHMKPTIRFKGSKAESPAVVFCALNSTLYMFEGDDIRTPPGEGEERFAGKFEMTPEILAGSDYYMEKQNLVLIKPMHQTKICPIALPTPDGKSILVFSSKFKWKEVEEEGLYGDSFELYNVGEDSWEALPLLPPRRPHDVDYIEAYGFQSDSRFVIKMDHGRLAFVLNLQTLEWELDLFQAPIFRLDGYFLGIDQFFITPHGAYDIRDGLGTFYFDPHLSALPFHLAKLQPGIALLGDEYGGGAYDIAVVQAERPSNCGPAHNNLLVMLDICCIDHVRLKRDLEKYKRDMEKYMGKVQESLPDMPLFNTSGFKTLRQFQRGYGIYKFDMERYMEQFEKAYEGKGQESPPGIPKLNTTVSKTLNFLIDFDFDYDYNFHSGNYIYANMDMFSI